MIKTWIAPRRINGKRYRARWIWGGHDGLYVAFRRFRLRAMKPRWFR